VSLPLFALVFLIVALGAVLQGSVGFGLGVFSVPFLLLIAPQLVPGPLLAATITITILIMLRERRDVRWRDLGWALGGRVFGIWAAVYVLKSLPGDDLAIVSALFVLIAVGLTASGLHLPPRPGILAGAGFASGLIGTVVAIGGPAIALVYQRESGPSIRGTLSAYFLIGITMTLVWLSAEGLFGVRDLGLAAALVPAVLTGYLASARVARVLDKGYIRPAILILSAAASVAVVLKQLWRPG
jgi:uncharacterized membrane protein YfcA